MKVLSDQDQRMANIIKQIEYMGHSVDGEEIGGWRVTNKKGESWRGSTLAELKKFASKISK